MLDGAESLATSAPSAAASPQRCAEISESQRSASPRSASKSASSGPSHAGGKRYERSRRERRTSKSSVHPGAGVR
eukprot:5840823-Prymnesium_polylepis.1